MRKKYPIKIKHPNRLVLCEMCKKFVKKGELKEHQDKENKRIILYYLETSLNHKI